MNLPVKLEVTGVGEDYVEMLPFLAYVKKDLRGLVDRLLGIEVEYSKIVLFGSYARLEEKVGSDYDILALTKTPVSREVHSELCSEFKEKNTDLIFFTDSEFSKSDSLLANQIRKDGVLLWKN